MYVATLSYSFSISNLFLATIDQQTKAHTSSSTPESIKKSILRDVSPLPITPASPSPPSTSISHESITPTILPLPLTNTQSVSYPYDNTPGRFNTYSNCSSIVSFFVRYQSI
jgi:hypothetical protein